MLKVWNQSLWRNQKIFWNRTFGLNQKSTTEFPQLQLLRCLDGGTSEDEKELETSGEFHQWNKSKMCKDLQHSVRYCSLCFFSLKSLSVPNPVALSFVKSFGSQKSILRIPPTLLRRLKTIDFLFSKELKSMTSHSLLAGLLLLLVFWLLDYCDNTTVNVQ